MATVTVRIPDDLYDTVKAAAERERRSINSELLWLIEKGLDTDGDVRIPQRRE